MAAGSAIKGAIKGALFGHKAFKWWRRNEVGKRILGKELTSEQIEIEVSEGRQVTAYSKVIVAVVGGALTLASKWIPALEGADAAMLVEAVMLALTALGVYAVPNKTPQ